MVKEPSKYRDQYFLLLGIFIGVLFSILGNIIVTSFFNGDINIMIAGFISLIAVILLFYFWLKELRKKARF